MLSKVVPNADVPIDINPLFSSYLFMIPIPKKEKMIFSLRQSMPSTRPERQYPKRKGKNVVQKNKRHSNAIGI
jgi:hypothetical protein